MQRSLRAVLFGTFTLRFSTGLTGALLAYYLADLPKHGGQPVEPIVVGLFSAAFFAAELVLSPLFGPLADRWGYHRVMQFGPIFGGIAVILTGLTTNLVFLGGSRLLEGASTAASVPSILGYIAIATAMNEQLRGRAVARFEAATLAGIGGGLVAAGPLFTLFGSTAFFINAVIYGGSFLIYRFGVTDPRSEHQRGESESHGLRRYLALLTSSHVWLLAPTWIAINAALGLWTTQSLFQLVRKPDPRFVDQMLMGGFEPVSVSAGLGVGLLIFFAGLIYWGNRFKTLRRTTIIFYGIVGGAVLILAAGVVNHSRDLGPASLPITAVFAVIAIAGLFVLAGATPAALGLLADVSERFPHDRGAIMGLYSVFLALGQITGSLLGGAAAEMRGIDGILAATLLLLAIALVPLFRLRRFEHEVEFNPGPPQGAVAPETSA